jgi:hypothetical protein
VKDLKTVDRSRTPWLIVSFHAPWYNSNYAHYNESEEFYMRMDMEPLLFSASVDVIISGHVHSYERMYPVYNNQLNDKGPVYINIGDGGNREGLATQWYQPQPTISAFRESSYGHGKLEIFNSSHMLWTWHKDQDYECQFSDDYWIVHDQEFLEKFVYNK